MLDIISSMHDNHEQALLINLYFEYYNLMKSTASKILHNQNDIEDVVHETFVGLIKRSELLVNLNSKELPAYVMTSLKNTAFKWLAKTNKRNSYESLTCDDEFMEWSSDGEEIPENVYIKKETLRALAAAVKKTPEPYKTMLEFRYILNLSDKEIAVRLNIKESYVRVYLNRIRKKLFAMVKGESDYD